MEKLNYDVVIIGFGKAGKTMARTLGKKGMKVALIEKSDQMFGGTCINEGCIPSKFLFEQANIVMAKKLSRTEAEAFYETAITDKNILVEKLRQQNYDKLESNTNVNIYVGEGKFISNHEVAVGDNILYGKYILINTGSTAIIPSIAGIENNPHIYTSKELLQLKKLPQHLVIVGGGYIGIEFASMFANFGSRITVITQDTHFLPREDRDIAKAVKNSLEKRDIKILMESEISSFELKDGYTQVHVKNKDGEQVLNADTVLIAIGRKPNIEHLNLDKAGIEVNEKGAIITDIHRRTNLPHIFAMGDVIGKLQFTYVSLDDYRIVKSALLENGDYNEEKRGVVPYSVFIMPPFSRVGMSEEEALQNGYEIKTAILPASAAPRAKVLGLNEGLLKVVVDKNTNLMLGAHLFCAESQEIINLFELAINMKCEYQVLRDMIFTHPSMSEVINDLLEQLD